MKVIITHDVELVGVINKCAPHENCEKCRFYIGERGACYVTRCNELCAFGQMGYYIETKRCCVEIKPEEDT